MAEAKVKELTGLPEKELKSRIEELKSDLIKASAQVATGTAPKNTSEIRDIKRSIAKILTVIRQKQLRAQSPKQEEVKENKESKKTNE
jgi:large subunit ribosomal protein L29